MMLKGKFRERNGWGKFRERQGKACRMVYSWMISMRLLPWVFIGREWSCLMQISGGNTRKLTAQMGIVGGGRF